MRTRSGLPKNCIFDADNDFGRHSPPLTFRMRSTSLPAVLTRIPCSPTKTVALETVAAGGYHVVGSAFFPQRINCVMSPKESGESQLDRIGEEPRTQVQPEDAIEASAELSDQRDRQHELAPRVTGYALTEKLGTGAYGEVWRAWQLRTRKEVAVKVFTQRSGLDWIFLQREVERLVRLDRHPNIVSLLDMGLDEEPPFYVMDVIGGGTLNQFVNPEAPADRDRTFLWLSEICDALSYVHAKGLIHCDLKPANILVDKRGHIRIVDFGQSRVFSESGATMGTLFFMPPEQARLAEPTSPIQPDVRWDIYAVGTTLYAILTGTMLFATRANLERLEEAPNLAERLERYRAMVEDGPPPVWNGQGAAVADEDLVAVVNKCMARRPEDRYASVAEIELDLQAMRERRPVSPLDKSLRYRIKRFLQRNPFKVGLVAAMIALGVALISVSIRQAKLDRAMAGQIMASFVLDPAEAVSKVGQARPRTIDHLAVLAERYPASAVFTERIMGARSGLWLDPSAFWESVETGPLWDHGEWLQLIDAYKTVANDDAVREVVETCLTELEAGLDSGSPREKYVALCLLGQLAPERSGLSERCASLVVSETAPGVVMGAAWAATRLGSVVEVPSSDRIFVDELTDMVFVAIPTADAFRRGSDPSDPDRFLDEDRPEQGVAIGPFYMATTEVTLAVFAGFFQEALKGTKIAAAELNEIHRHFKRVKPEDTTRVAIGGVSLKTARLFCEWLNARAVDASPTRTYRLPTEDEWEFAARGGNSGRFCFGDNAAYVPYFAHCNGSLAERQEVAQFMPNFYGLFDMHGGLWEPTESIYPSELAAQMHRNRELWVRRGGAWYSPAVRCRSAQRQYSTAGTPNFYNGIRLVMEVSR